MLRNLGIEMWINLQKIGWQRCSSASAEIAETVLRSPVLLQTDSNIKALLACKNISEA